MLSNYSSDSKPTRISEETYSFRKNRHSHSEIESFFKRTVLSADSILAFLKDLARSRMDLSIMKKNIKIIMFKKIETVLNSPHEKSKETFNATRVEIFWKLQLLRLTYDDFWKCHNKIIDCFILLLKENDALNHLHLAEKLRFSARELKQKSFNPFPALIVEIKKIHRYEDARKLLRSISLLGYNKNHMQLTEKNELLDALPDLLISINTSLIENKKKPGYLATFIWVFAKLAFDFSDFKERTWKNKPIIDYIIDYYNSCKSDFTGIHSIARCLWSMAVIDVPHNNRLYQDFIENSLPIIQQSNSIISMKKSTASQILLGKIAYQLHLSSSCIDYLMRHSNENQKKVTLSHFHKEMQSTVIELLNKERIKDPNIPRPPKEMTEYPVPGGHDAIILDCVLDDSPDDKECFGLEFDGLLHADRVANDKFKNRLLKLLGITVIRIPDSEILQLLNENELRSYLRKKVIEPYLEYHHRKMRKHTIEEEPEQKVIPDIDKKPEVAEIAEVAEEPTYIVKQPSPPLVIKKVSPEWKPMTGLCDLPNASVIKQSIRKKDKKPTPIQKNTFHKPRKNEQPIWGAGIEKYVNQKIDHFIMESKKTNVEDIDDIKYRLMLILEKQQSIPKSFLEEALNKTLSITTIKTCCLMFKKVHLKLHLDERQFKHILRTKMQKNLYSRAKH
jgi:hypothetical protein